MPKKKYVTYINVNFLKLDKIKYEKNTPYTYMIYLHT